MHFLKSLRALAVALLVLAPVTAVQAESYRLQGYQDRRGTAAEWTAANPTLPAGQMGLETDTGRLKWGDGTTPWTSLGYFGAGSVPITDSASKYASTTVEGALAEIGTAARTFQTVALLKAGTARFNGEVVNVACYYTCTTPDGGGGLFKWDSASSASDNGGTVIAPDAGGVGRWKLVHGGEVTSRQFGAKHDGTTDDAAKLTALFAAGAYSFTSVIDGGTLGISAAVTVPSGSSIRGGGARTTTLSVLAGDAAANVFSIGTAVDVAIADIGFDGNSHATTIKAIEATTVAGDRNITIKNVHLIDFDKNGSTTGAIDITQGNGVTIEGVTSSNCRLPILVTEPHATTAIRKSRLINTTANNMLYGIRVTAASEIDAPLTIEDNYISGANYDPNANGSTAWGITTDLNVRGAVIRGNKVTSSGSSTTNLGGGILARGHLVRVADNYAWANRAGFYFETEADNDTTVGSTGEDRGQIIFGNVARANTASTGFNASYTPGAIMGLNIAVRNAGHGFSTDSDRGIVLGNLAYNNTSKGIRGVNSRLLALGNHAFDNQASPAQTHGLGLDGGSDNVAIGNDFAGNLTAELSVGTDGRLTTALDQTTFRVGSTSSNQTTISQILSGQAAFNPTSLADGAVDAQLITVTGAAVGDPCFVTHDLIGANNVLVSAHVQSANNVRVTIMNKTGGNLDIGAGTLTVVVFKRGS